MYPTLAAALVRAKQVSGVSPIDEAYLSELLQMSVAKTPAGIDEYRPFWGAAKLVEQDEKNQRLTEADGNKFNNLQRKIDSLLAQQRSIDKALGLIVPEGMEALGIDCDPCQTKAEATTLPRRYPASVRTVLLP